MSFLLDTNVVSEWTRAQPNVGVIAWLAEADEDRVFLSVVTLAELRHGIERMAASRKRKRLEEWLQDELPVRFERRILPVDPVIADAWGRVVARCEDSGRPISTMDAFLAATAQVHGLTVVTRNVSDFEIPVQHVLNPWTTE